MAIQRAEAQTPAAAELTPRHTAAHKLPTNRLPSTGVRCLDADNLFPTVIPFEMCSRPTFVGRQEGKHLTNTPARGDMSVLK